MRRPFVLLASLAAMCALSLPFVSASEPALLRIATLAPEASSAGRVFGMFNAAVRKQTQGKLSLRLYAGGVAGDERDVIRKMKIGQMEGAALTSIGLGQIVRPVLVLQMPGLFEGRDKLAKVRKELAHEFEKQFQDAGYVLLGWGDVGDRRIFSQRPLTSPDDYKKLRPWVWRDDPISAEFMNVIGANGVALGLPEVFPALQTGMVDTITATAISALGLQWFRFVKHMSKSTGEPVVGAMVVRKPWFDALPPDVREALVECSNKVEASLLEQIHREDDQAAATLKARGMGEFDMMAQRSVWEPKVVELIERLTGKVYSRELLERVYKIAHDGKPLPNKRR